MDSGDDLRGQGLSNLIGGLAHGLTTLIKQEMHLARVELLDARNTVVQNGILLIAGFLVLLLALEAFVIAVILVLAERMAPWTAALAVALVMLTVAAVLLVVAKQRFSKAQLLPSRAVAGVQADVEMLKGKL